MDVSKVDAMLAQLRAAAALAGGKANPAVASDAATTTDFGSALKAALDQVNQTQQTASGLARSFETGGTDVNLTDVMTAMQKANISFQATVQVRNRLVSAYHDIMNMPI